MHRIGEPLRRDDEDEVAGGENPVKPGHQGVPVFVAQPPCKSSCIAERAGLSELGVDVLAGEVAMDDTLIELTPAVELPQVGSVVDHLGECVAEVGVLWPGLELDDDQLAALRETQEIDAPGRQGRLASDNEKFVVHAKIFGWDQVRVVEKYRLEFVLIVCGMLHQVDGTVCPAGHENLSGHAASLPAGPDTVRASTDRLRMLTPPQIRFPSATTGSGVGTVPWSGSRGQKRRRESAQSAGHGTSARRR